MIIDQRRKSSLAGRCYTFRVLLYGHEKGVWPFLSRIISYWTVILTSGRLLVWEYPTARLAVDVLTPQKAVRMVELLSGAEFTMG